MDGGWRTDLDKGRIIMKGIRKSRNGRWRRGIGLRRSCHPGGGGAVWT